jgi:hypothetical protein
MQVDSQALRGATVCIEGQNLGLKNMNEVTL